MFPQLRFFAVWLQNFKREDRGLGTGYGQAVKTERQ